MNPCEWNNKLTALLMGELSESEAKTLRTHLESCAQCKAAAEKLRATLALLEETLADSESEIVSEPKLDGARRAMLLDIQPEQLSQTKSHWFFRVHPAFKAAAALVVVLSIVVFGVLPSLVKSRSAGNYLSICAEMKTADYETVPLGGAEMVEGLDDPFASPDSFAVNNVDGLTTVQRAAASADENGREWYGRLGIRGDRRALPEREGRNSGIVFGKTESKKSENRFVSGVAGLHFSTETREKDHSRRDSGGFNYDGLERQKPAKPASASVKSGAVAEKGAEVHYRYLPSTAQKAFTKDHVIAPAQDNDEVLRRELREKKLYFSYADSKTSAKKPVAASAGKKDQSLRRRGQASGGLSLDTAGEVKQDLSVDSPDAAVDGTTVKKPAPVVPKIPVLGSLFKSREGQKTFSLSAGGGSKGDKAEPQKEIPASAKPAEKKQMVNLEIDLPKPQFTGTPKSLDSGYLSKTKEKKERSVDSLIEVREITASKKEGESDKRKRNFSLGLDLSEDLKTEEVAAGELMNGGEVGLGGTVVPLGDSIIKEPGEPDDAKGKPAKKVEPIAFNPFVMTSENNFSTFAIDVDTASYTLARQSIRSGAMPQPELVRTEEFVNAFDYGDSASEKALFRVYQDGAQSPFGAGFNMLRIGVKGRRLGREEQRPAMLTFVVDTSGSMAQPDRIGLARLALTLLMDQLSEHDRIQLIAYSDHAHLILEPVSASEKERVTAAFKRMQCNGSTNLEEGLQQAYAQAVQSFVPGAENRVILISDGVANLGADSAQEILDKVAASRKQGITCSVFGVGRGTYNDRMLEELANKGDGVYRFLDSAEEVKRAFVDDLAATLNTIAKDAKIQVEWNSKVVRRYRQLGYENRALTKEQFRDDSVDAGEVGSGQSVTALYELELMPGVTSASLLGTVRVRYQRTDTGRIEEIETELTTGAVLRPAHQADPSFKVAASAAEFAEQLRGCPHAAGGRLQDVADYLRPAVLELSLDTRIKELLDLVLAAEAMQ